MMLHALEAFLPLGTCLSALMCAVHSALAVPMRV